MFDKYTMDAEVRREYQINVRSHLHWRIEEKQNTNKLTLLIPGNLSAMMQEFKPITF
jgi:hypothetical protein